MKWEYRIEHVSERTPDSSNNWIGHTEDKLLNQLGQEGWEAISAWYAGAGSYSNVLLKRPVSD
jgi:hypothetical protein